MNVQDVVQSYLAAWNLSDGGSRRVALERLCTEDCRYADPLAEVSGPGGLDAVIAGAREKLPGFRFTLASQVEAHHDMARFTWQAALDDTSEPLVVGTDVIVLEDGRIRSVLGFLDKVPG